MHEAAASSTKPSETHVRIVLRTLCVLALLLVAMDVALAQDNFYVVSYLEAVPQSADQTRSLVTQYVKALRQEPGSVQSFALQRIGVPNQFAIVEVWKDKDAQASHAAAASSQGFRSNLAPLLRSPYDERTHVPINVVPATKPPASGSIYVVTHIDIFPPSQAAGISQIRTLADDSRKDDGNLRFDALQQTSRGNHETLVEAWENSSALAAHGASSHVKEFRAKLFPISGGLYDERIYQLIE
jgi:quinol monooxygenase YgiN